MEAALNDLGPTAVAPDRRLRVGLVLAVVLGLANLPFLFMPTPDGQEAPPMGVLVFSAALGVLSIVTAVLAWRTRNRVALRITAACVIINAITTLPALFADVDAGVKVSASVYVLASVLAVVLLLGRRRAA